MFNFALAFIPKKKNIHNFPLIHQQMQEDECPELGLTLQNHFRAIDVRMGKAKHSKHRQSLVTLSRRHSMIQMLDNLELDGPTPKRRISLSSSSSPLTSTNHYLQHLYHQPARSMDASIKRANVSHWLILSALFLQHFFFVKIQHNENICYVISSLVGVLHSMIWNKKVANWHQHVTIV